MQETIGTLEKVWQTAATFAVAYSFQILGALLILAVGLKLAAWLGGFVLRLTQKRGIDITLARFLAGTARLVIVAMVILAALNNFGITIAPFIAAIGAAAFGATVAIQGPLSNFGAGLSIILTRPFVIGNTIAVKGVSGVVTEISLSATILRGENGQTITVPNKQIVGEILSNSMQWRHVDVGTQVPDTIHPDVVIARVREVLASLPDVAKDPAPQVGISELFFGGVNLSIRFWVMTDNYLPGRFAANRALLELFEELGIRPKAGAAT